MKSNVEQTLKNFSKEDVERAVDQSITMWQWVAEHCKKCGINTKLEYFAQHELNVPMKACYLCELIRKPNPDKEYFGIDYPCCAELCPVMWTPKTADVRLPCEYPSSSPYFVFRTGKGKAQKVAALQIVALLQDVKDDLQKITEGKDNES